MPRTGSNTFARNSKLHRASTRKRNKLKRLRLQREVTRIARKDRFFAEFKVCHNNLGSWGQEARFAVCDMSTKLVILVLQLLSREHIDRRK
ncbi:MAG: hypothetical protein MHM6MM_005838 [Cercozoa sp. M6MM]